jgi:formiminoglutamate deiminase
MTTYLADYAWIDGRPVAAVRIELQDGRIVAVEPGAHDGVRLAGLVLPGFADTHSHAFHRALRGRTSDVDGSFWSWRKRMYEVAAQLDPDSYRTLATAVFAELALGGVTAVGEFHYLHGHYEDPNAMGQAMIEAAAAAGIRITLLDTCYLAGGLSGDGHLPLDGVQTRFADRDVDAWADRVAALAHSHSDIHSGRVRIGAAIHSVRAVPRAAIATVVAAAAGRPLHVHVSEQPAENEQCAQFYGCSPTELLASEGVLGPGTTAVHATHLSRADIERLGRSQTSISLCPTTERDLGDGLGPARALADAGAPIVLGTDQHVSADLFEEARGVEMHERLVSGQRGRFSPAELVAALTDAGHRSLGWTDAGRIEVGARADLVAVDLDSTRTAGADPAQVVMAATAADVRTVIAGGQVIVRDGHHELGDVGRLLADAINPLWSQ